MGQCKLIPSTQYFFRVYFVPGEFSLFLITIISFVVANIPRESSIQPAISSSTLLATKSLKAKNLADHGNCKKDSQMLASFSFTVKRGKVEFTTNCFFSK